MTISRRTLLKYGLGSIALSFTATQMGDLAANAARLAPRLGKSRILVLVQLSGGNDSLNMLVPFTNGHYYELRPTIAVPQEKVLQLNQQVGLHPAMGEMLNLFQKGNLAVVQAVGYAKPNRSHFRSIEIMQTAEPDNIAETGWLGRYLDCVALQQEKKLIPAMNVGTMLPKTLFSAGVKVPTVAELESYQDNGSSLQTMELLRKAGIDTSSGRLDNMFSVCRRSTKYPAGTFGDSLRFISQMIAGGLDCTIYSACLEGFDTHTNQTRQHGALLQQLSDGIAAFYEDLEEHKMENDVLLLTFSEFGRRAAENGLRGTDHGAAQAMFVAGGAVNGGVYGDHSSLSNLGEDGDLKHEIDFRSIYGTILDRWLGADSRLILGSQYGDDCRFLDV